MDNKPLIYYTITEALKSDLEKVFLSTDDEEIINYATQFDINIIRRPSYLASDEAKSFDVVKHAINEINSTDDNFCLLQPTSPLRRSHHINRALKVFHKDSSKVKSLVSVVQLAHNFNPESLMTLTKNGYLLNNHPGTQVFRRQEKKIYYARNGAALYIFNSRDLKANLLNGNIIGFEMKTKESVDIDSFEDLELAEILIKNFNK